MKEFQIFSGIFLFACRAFAYFSQHLSVHSRPINVNRHTSSFFVSIVEMIFISISSTYFIDFIHIIIIVSSRFSLVKLMSFILIQRPNEHGSQRAQRPSPLAFSTTPHGISIELSQLRVQR